MISVNRGRVEVSGGFLFLGALLWYLGRGEVLFSFLCAAALHEMAHVAALYALGAGVKKLRLTVVGAELVLDGRERLSYGGEFLAAAAGPGCSLLAGLLCAKLVPGWELFAGANLLLGLFNLLPLDPLDGGQMVRTGLSALLSPQVGERAAEHLGWITCGALLAAGGWIWFSTGYNLTLLAVGVWGLYTLLGRWGEGGVREKLFAHRRR